MYSKPTNLVITNFRGLERKVYCQKYFHGFCENQAIKSLSLYISVCLFVCLSIYLSSVCPSICLSIYLSFVCSSVCLFVCVSFLFFFFFSSRISLFNRKFIIFLVPKIQDENRNFFMFLTIAVEMCSGTIFTRITGTAK
jgi:hypothetical protein